MSQSPVVLVSDASRGAGRGIATALGAHGCTVYVTGRSKNAGDHPLPGTICETAEAVPAAGGKGRAVACDHSDDEQVKALFERIGSEQGRLDILVNNAAAVYDELTLPGHFREKPLKMVFESDREKFGALEAMSESPKFRGHIIWALFNDQEMMVKTGKTFIGRGTREGLRHTRRWARSRILSRHPRSCALYLLSGRNPVSPRSCGQEGVRR